ncbi:hypothetical protein ACFQDD_00610 [Halorubrum pallidum]|uniref:Uncharacterized protein n=1 Tax=Halorubrum pallidum TaxID=1526114 RepID=A0ABD5T2D0_9EURY
MSNNPSNPDTADSDVESEQTETTSKQRLYQSLKTAGVSLVILILFASQPVAAQGNESLVCGSDFLESTIQAFVTATSLSAVILFVALYQMDAIMEMVAMSPESQQKVKQHEKKLWGALIKIIVVGPGVTAIGGMIGWEFASCIDLVPFF